MLENPTVAFVVFGGQILIFLPLSLFVVHRTLQTREERGAWKQGKLWLGVF
jgi:hypothetical protein